MCSKRTTTAAAAAISFPLFFLVLYLFLCALCRVCFLVRQWWCCWMTAALSCSRLNGVKQVYYTFSGWCNGDDDEDSAGIQGSFCCIKKLSLVFACKVINKLYSFRSGCLNDYFCLKKTPQLRSSSDKTTNSEKRPNGSKRKGEGKLLLGLPLFFCECTDVIHSVHWGCDNSIYMAIIR